MKNFYPQSYVVRLLFCVVLTILAANLGMFVRDVVISHGQYVFNAVKGLAIPAAFGTLAAFMWKPRA